MLSGNANRQVQGSQVQTQGAITGGVWNCSTEKIACTIDIVFIWLCHSLPYYKGPVDPATHIRGERSSVGKMIAM